MDCGDPRAQLFPRLSTLPRSLHRQPSVRLTNTKKNIQHNTAQLATMAVSVLNGVNGAEPGAQRLWVHPSPETTPMHSFLQHINKKYHLQLRSYKDLHAWSVENIAAFWGEVWNHVGIKASQPYEQVPIAADLPLLPSG